MDSTGATATVEANSFWSTFRDLAQRAGAVEAILEGERTPLCFAGLPERLLAVRDSLAARGIGRGDRVASVLPNGPETAVCFVGVASCAVYAPLNPQYTQAELTRYLTRLRPRAIILPESGAAAARAAAAAVAIPIIDLVSARDAPAGAFSLTGGFAAGPTRAEWNSGDDTCLVLLTSGTGSAQKLVPLRQRHLLAYARAAANHYRLGATDRGLHVMPMFHGHGLKSSLLVPLASGSGVICTREFDISSFFRQIDALRPTWYTAAASIHHAIWQRIDAFRDVAAKAGLRFIRSGSGRLDPKVMAGLEEAFGAPMVERYGMSETCTLTSNPLPPGLRKAGSVGKPMSNEVAILGERGDFLGPGSVGEVVARGPTIFDGYLDDVDATREAFVDGWFRTGDLGRFDADGYLELVGRLKETINRGGEKIGALEVEAALLRHPAVAEACVIPIAHPSLGEEIGAAVVLAPNLQVSERELRAHARGMLTGFKVPRRIFFLRELPKGATRKIRRDTVAAICHSMLGDDGSADAGIVAPDWLPLELEIAGLWRRALVPPPIAIERDDDFFLLGGDSLQAYELFAQLRTRYGLALGLGHLFDDAATVAGMARMVERNRRQPLASGTARSRLVAIKDDGCRPPLFAIPGSGGNPVGYVHLGRLLDRRQPLIGIESRGLDGSSAPLTRVEDIAADNLALIRDMQPVGPYFLCGACYGARVAYEMARQLDAAGERVGLLLMLDPSSPFHRADGRRRGEAPHRAPKRQTTRFLLDRLALYASQWRKLDTAARAAFLHDKILLLRDAVRQRDLFRGDRSELHQRQVYAANREAGQHYVPGPFGGPAVLCFTRNRPIRSGRNYRLDWCEVLPQSGEPRFVAGSDSGEMLNLPHVYELAACVNRWLEQAQARDSGTAQTLQAGQFARKATPA